MNWKSEEQKCQMQYKGAIFDMDGTLFDTERLYQETWRELAKERNICLDDSFIIEISGTNGTIMKHIIEKYYRVSDGLLIVDECMKRMKQKLETYVPLKKGVPEILEYLRGIGMRLAVASSSSIGQIEANLKKSGISDYFHTIVSGEEVKYGKPAPDIFVAAARKIGCKPEECIVFEDSENGIKAGYLAGCHAIMIPDLVKPCAGTLAMCLAVFPDFLKVREAMEES